MIQQDCQLYTDHMSTYGAIIPFHFFLCMPHFIMNGRHKSKCVDAHFFPDEHTRRGRTKFSNEHTGWGRTINKDEDTD